MQKIRRADFNIDLEKIIPISTGFCTEKHTFFKKHRREWGAPKIFIKAFPAVCPMLLENTVAYANRDGCMRKSTSKYTRFMKKVPRFPPIEFFFRTKTKFYTSKNVRFSSTFFLEFLRHTQARCRAWQRWKAIFTRFPTVLSSISQVPVVQSSPPETARKLRAKLQKQPQKSHKKLSIKRANAIKYTTKRCGRNPEKQIGDTQGFFYVDSQCPIPYLQPQETVKVGSFFKDARSTFENHG